MIRKNGNSSVSGSSREYIMKILLYLHVLRLGTMSFVFLIVFFLTAVYIQHNIISKFIAWWLDFYITHEVIPPKKSSTHSAPYIVITTS